MAEKKKARKKGGGKYTADQITVLKGLEAVRKRPEAVRSFHPTHAVAVIGPDAESLVEGDVECGALGRDCALDRLRKGGGYVFLLGVSQEYNSTIHIGEDYGGDNRTLGIFNPENPKIVILNHPEQGEIEVPLSEMMGNTVAFVRMYDELQKRGQLIEGHIGKAPCQLMKGQHIIDAAVKPIDVCQRNMLPHLGDLRKTLLQFLIRIAKQADGDIRVELTGPEDFGESTGA